jgi:hypothetical protein
MEPEAPFPCQQDPATGLYPELAEYFSNFFFLWIEMLYAVNYTSVFRVTSLYHLLIPKLVGVSGL